MKPGSLMKALIRPGAGDKTPSDGDQVYHYSFFSQFLLSEAVTRF